jgi:hypothetical protein
VSARNTLAGHRRDRCRWGGDRLAALGLQPLHRLQVTDVGVNAGDHDSPLEGEQRDPDHRDPDRGIDHQPLVQQDVQRLGQAVAGDDRNLTP